ncbi:MAG: DUF2071 domain-containing protein [Leptospiraceae bacterium]|nr:DUF2071 domain-containing protein [Leptospiraceae bacterium]
MKQDWLDLLFLHWETPVDKLRELIPKQLEVDLWEGKAYLGIVPFKMRNVRPRFFPSVPYLSFFPELNVRTYVKVNGKPGVWFFSLDAGNSLAVEIARKFFYLPYFNADFKIQYDNSSINYRSIRKDSRGNPAVLELKYAPTSEVYFANQGSLEHWLTERYCLYSMNKKGKIFRGEIHHLPWPLQKAQVEISQNEMAKTHNLTIKNQEPIKHFIKKIEVGIYLLEEVRF